MFHLQSILSDFASFSKIMYVINIILAIQEQLIYVMITIIGMTAANVIMAPMSLMTINILMQGYVKFIIQPKVLKNLEMSAIHILRIGLE